MERLARREGGLCVAKLDEGEAAWLACRLVGGQPARARGDMETFGREPFRNTLCRGIKWHVAQVAARLIAVEALLSRQQAVQARGVARLGLERRDLVQERCALCLEPRENVDVLELH